MDHHTESAGKGESSQPFNTANWTIQFSEIKTVKVANVAQEVSERDLYEFFSFSGQIEYIEMQRETEMTKVAFVTFQDSQGADTAALLTGAVIAGISVSVTLCKDYQLPPNAVLFTSNPAETGSGSAVSKAEDVVTTMLAKGFVLGKDALNTAKAFDEKHQLTSNASATVASLDRRMGLSRKFSMGTAVMNEKVKEMDERFQVSEKTKSAYAVAEEKASNAGTAIMSNRYVSTGALWVTSALIAVSRAAEEVSARTKEKVEKAEEGKEEICYKQVESEVEVEAEATNAKGNESPTIPVISADETKQIG